MTINVRSEVCKVVDDVIVVYRQAVPCCYCGDKQRHTLARLASKRCNEFGNKRNTGKDLRITNAFNKILYGLNRCMTSVIFSGREGVSSEYGSDASVGRQRRRVIS